VQRGEAKPNRSNCYAALSPEQASPLGIRNPPTSGFSVANIKSQIKRNRQNEKRRVRNKGVRSEIRTRTKTAIDTAASGVEEQAEALRLAMKRIDKAASKGVIHKNQAANRKSRLMRRIATFSGDAD
jgi:small subunit ribosomal protein S20